MKVHRLLLALAFAAGAVPAAGLTASAGTDTTAPGSDTTPPGTEATEGTGAVAYDVEATGTCDGGPMEMWERTGGNAAMVDALVAAWNQVYPDCEITLTYIEHSEMVPQLARGIAAGDVPDLMGLDLIYGPQFEAAGQLEDITDLIGDDPLVENIVEGHRANATYEDHLYGVPLYADASMVLWNKALFEEAGLDPEVPPTNLQEIHDMAAEINDPDNGVYGYYLPGNCAGCNIFTFGPLIWASGGTIEPAACGEEALVGDSIPEVLEWARMMHQEGLIDPAAQAETGATFAEVFGSGNVGIMGTGNFNVALAKSQNPDIDLGVALLPGLESGQTASFAGGDIVTVPKGSERLEDSVEFMKFILSDQVQTNVYQAIGNLPTRTDIQPAYDDQDVADTLEALPVAQTPVTPVFFEMINSPQGPWLQMLQRVYYSDEAIEDIIADTKATMEEMSCQGAEAPATTG
jgi:multiple sugar transport system substrate-binding protein